MVRATATTLLHLCDLDDPDVNVMIENTLSYADIIADTFTIMKKDLESGALLRLDEGEEVDLFLLGQSAIWSLVQVVC